MIKFKKFYISNGTDKALVHYSLDNRTDNRTCVTIYEKGYSHNLSRIFAGDDYRNDTDSQSDYYDSGRVVLFEEHPLYATARLTAEGSRIKKDDSATVDARVLDFAAGIEAAELAGMIRRKCDCESNRQSIKTRIVQGKKYTRVDIGTSAAYMIDQVGNIYGCKGYGIVNTLHRYGTLDAPRIQSRY